jgi:two-component system cell cycle response regulator
MTAKIPTLVERRKYDTKLPQQIAPNLWWVGYADTANGFLQNPYLLLDNEEAVLINPGSRADGHHRIILDKIRSVIDLKKITHLIVQGSAPDLCASMPLFEKAVGKEAQIYAPRAAFDQIRYFGSKREPIPLDDGDSIIFNSRRTLDFYFPATTDKTGANLIFDRTTRTLFSGNLLCTCNGDGELFAGRFDQNTFSGCDRTCYQSKRELWQTLNKIEMLAPDRICPQHGPIFEEDLDKYLAAARSSELEQQL